MSNEEIAISFLMGCVLGDANISKRSNSGKVQVVFSHSIAQIDLLKWKAQQVKALFDIETEVHSYDIFFNGKKFNRTMLSFTTGGVIKDVYEWFYPAKQK